MSPTIIAAVLLFISSVYQTYMLSKVHTLVNSNFTEAKQARIAAEGALKIANALNVSLQKQVNTLESTKPTQ